MEWSEPQEMAIARAKLRNHIDNRPIIVAISAIIPALVPMLIPIVIFIQRGKVTMIVWEMTFAFVALSMIIGVLLHIYYHWHRPEKNRIGLGSQSFTITSKRTLRNKGINITVKYDEFVGFSIFDIPSGKLLVFGEREGKNLSIGIPPEISMDDIRSFLSGRLREITNEEMPDRRKILKR